MTSNDRWTPPNEVDDPLVAYTRDQVAQTERRRQVRRARREHSRLARHQRSASVVLSQPVTSDRGRGPSAAPATSGDFLDFTSESQGASSVRSSGPVLLLGKQVPTQSVHEREFVSEEEHKSQEESSDSEFVPVPDAQTESEKNRSSLASSFWSLCPSSPSASSSTTTTTTATSTTILEHIETSQGEVAQVRAAQQLPDSRQCGDEPPSIRSGSGQTHTDRSKTRCYHSL